MYKAITDVSEEGGCKQEENDCEDQCPKEDEKKMEVYNCKDFEIYYSKTNLNHSLHSCKSFKIRHNKPSLQEEKKNCKTTQKIFFGNCQDFEFDCVDTNFKPKLKNCKGFKIFHKTMNSSEETQTPQNEDFYTPKNQVQTPQNEEFLLPENNPQTPRIEEYLITENKPFTPRIEDIFISGTYKQQQQSQQYQQFSQLQRTFSDSLSPVLQKVSKKAVSAQKFCANEEGAKNQDNFLEEVKTSKNGNLFLPEIQEQSQQNILNNEVPKNSFFPEPLPESSLFQYYFPSSAPRDQQNSSSKNSYSQNHENFNFGFEEEFPQLLENKYNNKINSKKDVSVGEMLSENQKQHQKILSIENLVQNFDSKRIYLICIESVNFPNCFLRADLLNESGAVNFQSKVGSLETWKVHFCPGRYSFFRGKKNIFAFEMLTQKNVFLGVSPTTAKKNFCASKFSVGLIYQNPKNITEFETWEIIDFKDGKFGIKNRTFPPLYLSFNGEIDQNMVYTSNCGFGKVVLAEECGINEQFYISSIQ